MLARNGGQHTQHRASKKREEAQTHMYINMSSYGEGDGIVLALRFALWRRSSGIKGAGEQPKKKREQAGRKEHRRKQHLVQEGQRERKRRGEG
jgi:hypothetical protein